MATSSKSTSTRKAQVPVSCYFCKGQGIKWKCEDCNVRMCNSCKVTIHQGLQSAKDHDVISIQDMSKSPGFQEVTSVVIASVFNSYTTTVPAVNALLCSEDDLLYFIYHDGETAEKHLLVKGKLLKSSIKILQTRKTKLFDIAINKDGEILLREFDNEIKILSSAGEVTTVLDTTPMELLAIHVNKDNEVIVGLREQGPPFPVQDFSVRQVMIFGSDYQRKETIEYDKKRNKLFSYVFRIRTNSKKVIFVVDCFDDEDNGRVVAVDRNGHLKFTYDGQKDNGTFRPGAISITPSDNIVVADYYNDSLHVLNTKGDLLGIQFIFKDLGIYEPRSLCFDTEGYLLIGCSSGENEDFGKIHVVKMTDSLM